MADEALSALSNAFTYGYSTSNELLLLDVLDTSMAATGTDKRITVAQFLASYVSATGLTSVGLAVPSGLSVSGSPLTSNGTITISTALSGLLKGTGSGFTVATSGTDYVAPGGTWPGNSSITTVGTLSSGTVPGSLVSGNIAGNAASITGSITTSQISNLSSWSGSTAITTLGTVATGTWHGSPITASYLTPPTGASALIYNNAGAFGAATNWTIGSNATLTGTAISDPGSPNAGDIWISSVSNSPSFQSAGLTARGGGVIWQQLAAGTAVVNTSAQSSLLQGGTQLGSLVIPANALTPGKIIRLYLQGTFSDVSTVSFSSYLLLGGVQIAYSTISMTASLTNKPFVSYDPLVIQVLSVGSSGTVIGWGVNINHYGIANNEQLSSGGLGVVTAPVSVNTTNALTLDFQVKWGAASASNTVQLISGWASIDG